MAYAIVGQTAEGVAQRLRRRASPRARAARLRTGPSEDAALVLNIVDRARPRPFRRRSRGTFVAALHALEESPPDPLREGYPVLVRALANLSLAYVPGTGVWFTTLERGSYLVRCDDGLHTLARKVVDRLEPLARSRLVIDNEFRPDLEPELWGGDAITRVDRGRRPAARHAGPAAGAVPGRGSRRRERPAAHQAAVRDRRPLVRQPVRAQGRDALLDERERGRQGEARDSRP